MDNRSRSIDAFLQHTGWGRAERAPLAGDASFRRYVRLFHPSGETAMLMDAPPPQEDIRPFIKIAECLLELSFSAPRIFHTDIEHGFLLLEDFGDATYTQLLAQEGSGGTGTLRKAKTMLKGTLRGLGNATLRRLKGGTMKKVGVVSDAELAKLAREKEARGGSAL